MLYQNNPQAARQLLMESLALWTNIRNLRFNDHAVLADTSLRFAIGLDSAHDKKYRWQ